MYIGDARKLKKKRNCCRKKLPDDGGWDAAYNYVAKRYLSSVESSVYLDDVRLQMEAKLWAEEFNRHDPPKKASHKLCVFELLWTRESP